jgi:hypothetical protein
MKKTHHHSTQHLQNEENHEEGGRELTAVVL